MVRVHYTTKRTETTILSTNEPTGHALALNLVALIEGLVLVVTVLCTRVALGELAVERLDLCSPELEVTHVGLLVAAESNLWRAVGKHIQDLPVWSGSGINSDERGKNALVTSHI